MKNYLLVFVFLLSIKLSAQTPCDIALNQLSSYAQQCNLLYAQNYQSIVYYNRCGYYSFNCLYSLNSWYYSECIKVNNWYVAIVNQCTNESVKNKPAPKINKNKTDIEQPDIDTSEIEDLADEIDDEKSTKIRIPDNPIGWKP
jgi:hypothetical protein